MSTMKVRLTFTEPVLGSTAGDPEITRSYIASKAEDAKKIEEEVAAIGVDGVEEKTMTIFPKLEDGTPFLWDYQVKGFFKSACQALNMADAAHKLTAYKKKIEKQGHCIAEKCYGAALRSKGTASQRIERRARQGIERIKAMKAMERYTLQNPGTRPGEKAT